MKGNSFGRRCAAAAMMVTAALAGCGDVETTDRRGYTKAPLEEPGVFIRSEETTAMSRLGEPNLPEAVEITRPDTAASSAAGQTQP